MKLIIQIPCYNEEEFLPETLKHLPQQIQGIDVIETLIIDDGSTDRTVEVARDLGVDHIVRLSHHQGLAKAFKTGLEECLRRGADIIVNTDADNQYYGGDIQNLVAPILQGEAMMVVGDRQVMMVKGFSWSKKFLQKLGSFVVKKLSHTRVPDVTSGFRAFSREAALRINVLSSFSYTLETIIQAGLSNISISHVKIKTNPQVRPSRLFRSNFFYVLHSTATILRVYVMYKPLKTFFYLGSFISSIGLLLIGRFFYAYFFTLRGGGKIQSLIIAAILVIIGVQVFVMGILADVVSANRVLLEDNLYQVRRRIFEDRRNTPRVSEVKAKKLGR